MYYGTALIPARADADDDDDAAALRSLVKAERMRLPLLLSVLPSLSRPPPPDPRQIAEHTSCRLLRVHTDAPSDDATSECYDCNVENFPLEQRSRPPDVLPMEL